MNIKISVYHKALLIFLLLSLIQACTTQVERPIKKTLIDKEQPFLGVAFNKDTIGKGLEVILILPGPMRQALQEQNLLLDIKTHRLISINNQSVNKDNFKQELEQYSPSETVTLMFDKYPQASKQIDPLSIDVVLGSQEHWTGPIFKVNQLSLSDKHIKHLPKLSEKTWIQHFIDKQVKEYDLKKSVDDLYALFFDSQEKKTGFHSLSRVMFPFQEPERLLELEETITLPLATLDTQTNIIFNEIAANLDLQKPDKTSCTQKQSWLTFLNSIKQSHEKINLAFKQFDNTQIKKINQDFDYLITQYSSMRTLGTQSDPLQSLNAMNASMQIDYNALLNSAVALTCFIDKDITLTANNNLQNIPTELKNAIKGEVKSIIQQDGLWIVYGSKKDNHYDMSIIDIVYDPSGNDTYQHAKPEPLSLKFVIDKNGNDEYLSQYIGAAASWLGLSLLVDHKGNDVYQGNIAANGVGMMGIGLLIDYAGKDTYEGNFFSNGAGFYGAGVLMDLGNEGDVYNSATFSQGFGGPRGLGLIFDNNGNDYYRANNITPSVYGTEGVFASFSQGVGFGLRGYDSGGIGIIYDKQGSDHYEGGEFSQAGGYYWGLGIIHDSAGDDDYSGNRYSQGFGVHQATGILFDREGNDSYQATTAACQGAAWDIALGLLVDIKGNDTYQGDHLCQGSGAMQAMGWLIDLNGTDHYNANSSSSQGRSGTNTYHYDPESPVYSWSMLLDTGGQDDHFSNLKENNQIIPYSEVKLESPAESRSNGLFIDTAALLDLRRTYRP